MLSVYLLIPTIGMTNSGVSCMEKKMLEDAKQRIKKQLDLKKLKHEIRRSKEGHEIEFYPKEKGAVGYGAICYYAPDGSFQKIIYTQ